MSDKYYKSGALKEQCSKYSAGGKKNGLSKLFYESGALLSEGMYSYDSPRGQFKRFYESGAVLFEYGHKNGEIDGVAFEYYESGSIKTKMNFINGNLQGLAEEYFENGELKQGQKLTYNDRNELVLRVNYVNGKEVGRWEKEIAENLPVLSNPLKQTKPSFIASGVNKEQKFNVNLNHVTLPIYEGNEDYFCRNPQCYEYMIPSSSPCDCFECLDV